MDAVGGEDSGVDPVKAAEVCAALDNYLESTGTPGGSVAVRFIDGSEHVCVAGMANIEASRPVSEAERFRLNSITKTFVGALILLLAEDGLLSLEDPLSDHVTGFDGSDPTIAQLLNHSSGIGEYIFDDVLRADSARPHTEDELLTVARSKPIEFEPGTRFEYSNTNFLLLGVIASEAGEGHWSEQVRARILNPLGLNNTFVDAFEEVPGDSARGYDVSGTAPVDITDTFHLSVGTSAGCMVSNARDLLHWGSAIYGGEVLSEESFVAMTQTYRIPYQNEEGVSESDFVGLADFIGAGDEDFGDVHGHSGGSPGFLSNIRYLERDGASQVILVNAQTSSDAIKSLTEELWSVLLL